MNASNEVPDLTVENTPVSVNVFLKVIIHLKAIRNILKIDLQIFNPQFTDQNEASQYC